MNNIIPIGRKLQWNHKKSNQYNDMSKLICTLYYTTMYTNNSTIGKYQ